MRGGGIELPPFLLGSQRLLGGYTTFSAFSLDASLLCERSETDGTFYKGSC
jgi:fluoride ion exporter CrcB/FEX